MATYASRPRPAPAAERARRVIPGRPAALAGLLALVVVAVVLRTTELSIGFWIDEGLSVGIADRPLGDIPGALRQDGSPPVYYMLLHFWIDVVGRSEADVRLLSVLFGVLAVPVAWWAGRTLLGSRRGAWTAGLLAATNPFLTQYAQEARMYSLVALLGLVATTCFVRAYAIGGDRRGPWIAGFVVADVLALYTHNWPLFFTAACGLGWLGLVVSARRDPAVRRRLLRDGVVGFGAIAVLYAPWIPTTLYQAAHTGAPWSDAPALSSLLDVPHQLLGRMPLLALALTAGAGLLALRRREGGDGGRRVALVLAVLAVLTVTLPWLASQSSPAWANRYLAIGLFPFVLLAAAGLSAAGRVGLVGLAVVAVLWAMDAAPSEKSNVRAVAQAVAPSLSPGDLVISTQPESIPVLHYYLRGDGLRFATLTGAQSDLGVWDWRDGVQRLEATSVSEDLRPLVDALQPGRRVVVVVPDTQVISHWRAPWTRLIRLRSQQWLQYLSNRRDLVVTTVAPGFVTRGRPIPVQATVWTKTRTPAG